MRHGSNIDPPNRFESVRREADLADLEWDQEYLRTLTHRPIEYLDDRSQSIVSRNESPDVPYNYSVNPYRGCVHACCYCYARPYHEYLGFNAGLDFETKIMVKRDAARLLRAFLARSSWRPEPINFSGVTDCYQPIERQLCLTRQCLEVAWECRQPVSIVTKNALVVRDLDLLRSLAQCQLVQVLVSITTLDPQLARELEPRTSIPAARLRAIETLAAAGIPVGVLLAPVIPGLNDTEIPRLLAAARDCGAQAANYVLLRLPRTVAPVFVEWLERTRPLAAGKVLARLQCTRGGQLNRSDWGERMVGTGAVAEQIGSLFRLFRRQLGLAGELPAHNCELFRPPPASSGQLRLF
jgi:DNA repair photolyase